VGVNSYQNFAFIREFTGRPVSALEAAAGCAVKGVNDLNAGLVVLVSNNADFVRYVCKYRPRVSGTAAAVRGGAGEGASQSLHAGGGKSLQRAAGC
jgi:hypothetical protein